MPVEWQGDHKILGDEKNDFERELFRLGFDPGDFLVEVRRDTSAEGSDGRRAVRYDVYVNDLKHPDRETWKLEGGQGKTWVAQFTQAVKSRRG